jgi:hypothetical protein
MRRRFHPTILKEFNRRSCGMRPSIICMHPQVAITFRGVRSKPLGKWQKYPGDRMLGLEFPFLFENTDQTETAQIPNYLWHEFFYWVV